MMYIVLTAMLALNVAAEVLEAFRVVDASLTQTIRTIDMKNSQVYSSFEQSYIENKTKVQEWKTKADSVRSKSNKIILDIWTLKEELVKKSGAIKIEGDVQLRPDDPFFVNHKKDTFRIKKEDDLNSPSEMMITQKGAEELKNKIIQYKEFLAGMIKEEDSQLKATIFQELNTDDPPAKLREGGETKSWEVQRFDSKPLIAVITLLSNMQIDIKNAESHVINYLFAQIDAGSFKFNKLGARVIPNSSTILQGDEFIAEVFLAAEDTTQSPEIIILGKSYPVVDGKATYKINTTTPGMFKWSGLIKYKTPEGIFQDYPFEHEYQVTKPSVTVSATKMNVFYKGIANPVDISGGAIPNENLRPVMANGTIEKVGDLYYVYPTDVDETSKKTRLSVYANIGGTERLIETTEWRVKRVPDPIAKIAGQSGGNITKSRISVEDGIEAILEDFDFDFYYKIIQFDISLTDAQGYTSKYQSTTDRFTQDMKSQFKRLNTGSIIYIDNIKARGDDNSVRDLDVISFKIQ